MACVVKTVRRRLKPRSYSKDQGWWMSFVVKLMGCSFRFVRSIVGSGVRAEELIGYNLEWPKALADPRNGK